MLLFPPSKWASHYYYGDYANLNTNNKLERYFHSMKVDLPSPPPTIDVSVNHLYKLAILQEKEIIIATSRRQALIKKPGSKTKQQATHGSTEPASEELLPVKKPMDDLLYRLKKNCTHFIYHSLYLI
jgi:hypothetical protein